MKDDRNPSVSELIEDRVMWLDYESAHPYKNDNFDDEAPDETIVGGTKTTKFNPEEGETTGGFSYEYLRSLDDATEDLSHAERTKEKRMGDAATWMSQLELPDSERRRVNYLLNRVNFAELGNPLSEAVVLAIITIVVSERERNVGGWFWKKLGEIEKSVNVEHHKILKVAQQLMKSERFPSVEE